MNFGHHSPKPGDIGLSYGEAKFSKYVRFAQALLGDWAIYSHAFIYLGEDDIIEALPNGAKINKLSDYDPNNVVFSHFSLSRDQRSKIVEEAIQLEGTGYSRLDFLAIGLNRFCGRCWWTKWARKRVHKTGKMICSQLVAEAYRRAGIELEPGSDPQDLTPGDLSRIIMLNYGRKYYV